MRRRVVPGGARSEAEARVNKELHAVFFIRDTVKFQLATFSLFVSFFLMVKIRKDDQLCLMASLL